MSKKNILVILDDEHQRSILGAMGDAVVETPNLDALARRGALFRNAYTPSPICVPARASLHTGRHVHQGRWWDSTTAYRGEVKSWAHRLRDEGYDVTSIGKLHFRSAEDDNGFSREIEPMHLKGGLGWVRALLRRDPPVSTDCYDYAVESGAGETSYTAYDGRIAEQACDYLRARQAKKEPFAAFVSFISPHFPLIAPQALYQRYADKVLPEPILYRQQGPRHPVIERLVEAMPYDERFTPETFRKARAAYYGLVTLVDEAVGKILKTLRETRQEEETTIVFSSDHGDSLGSHSLWAKSTMYEHSAGVPMIVAGPGVPAGRVVETPTSLIDVYPTVVKAAGLTLDEEERALPGRSLVEIAQAGDDMTRPAFSEYHDGGSITGFFMLRLGRWKYVHYAGYRPELYDLESDPKESRDLGDVAAFAAERRAMEKALRQLVDPEAVSAAAFTDQARAIERLGGEAAVRAIPDFGYTPVASPD